MVPQHLLAGAWLRSVGFACFVATLLVGGRFSALAAETSEVGVTAPPESFFEIVSPRDREAAQAFYKKYLPVGGLAVVAAEDVSDKALVRTQEIVLNMLSGRPDVLERMVDDGMYLIIIGKDQAYCDMPENRNVPNKAYMNERVRGTGGRPTSFGEENLLSLALDRYDDESIGVHEFAHTIDGTLRSLDPTWRGRLREVYQAAVKSGVYQGAYANSNAGEYWAEIVQAYFDCNRINNYNHGPIGIRELLKEKDPKGYELVDTTLRVPATNTWRYEFLTQHPTVIDPPTRFTIDPYYTKFSWAREFIVLSKTATDEQLITTNKIIRHLFAYRHDVLKTLINRDTRLIVLGENETLADLPQWPLLQEAGLKPDARFAPFQPSTNVIVVDGATVQETLAAEAPLGNPVIYAMTDAFYQLTADRPIDPNWENRGRDVQQYELRVTRLDERFGEKVRAAWEAAQQEGRWQDNTAITDAKAYLCAGVLAYFDAGSHSPPADATQPISQREALHQYDPALYELVHELVAYEGRVDWRLSQIEPGR